MEEPIDIAEEEDAPVDSLPGVEVGDQIPLPARSPCSRRQHRRTVPTVRCSPARCGRFRFVRTARWWPVKLPRRRLPAHRRVLDAGPRRDARSRGRHRAAAAVRHRRSQHDHGVDGGSGSGRSPSACRRGARAGTPARAQQQVAAVEARFPPMRSSSRSPRSRRRPRRESLSNLGKRYSSVIGGRNLGIKSAEIPARARSIGACGDRFQERSELAVREPEVGRRKLLRDALTLAAAAALAPLTGDRRTASPTLGPLGSGMLPLSAGRMR